MANKAGFSDTAVGGMLRHYTREPDPKTGKYQVYPRGEGGGHIDPDKTAQNYSIGECHDAAWVRTRLRGVYQRPQDKGKTAVMLDIVVTLPKGEPRENSEAFFQAAYESLCRQYGRENNIVGCWVHRDEAEHHLHFAFLPIVPKTLKSCPEVKEGISQSAFFPKKSALRQMHEVLQRDISERLGHRVAILNGATAGGNKTISELKAESRKYMEAAHENRQKLDDIAENVKEARDIPLVGKKVYQLDPEHMEKVLFLAAAGATAEATDRERMQELQNARAKEQQADKERTSAVSELNLIQAELQRVRYKARAFLAVPDHLRPAVENELEEMRMNYHENADQIHRDICKLFLDSGRDFRQTVKNAEPLMDAIGVKPAERDNYVKACLSAAMKQARAKEKSGKAAEAGQRAGSSERSGAGSAKRRSGWNPKPARTDYSLPATGGQVIPVLDLRPYFDELRELVDAQLEVPWDRWIE